MTTTFDANILSDASQTFSNENSCKNTVYQIPSDDMTTIFDANILSDASQTCEYIFFAGTKSRREDLPFIWIHKISTTSNTSLTFLSTINKNELFKINDSEASQWQNIGIYTPALSVIVPPLTKFSIHFSNVYPQQPHYNTGNFQQKGIMTSPSYCGFMDTFFGSKLYNFQFADNTNVELNFIKFYGNNFPVLKIAEENKTYLKNVFRKNNRELF
uniref:Uncharacterized protein n=1 Tax=Panagrolaimus sp. PS1159 TaxID=55785 RepID=A0AC35EW03_9BILA